MYRTSIKRLYTLVFALVCTSLLVMLTIFVIKIIGEQQQYRFANDFLKLVNSMSVETTNNLATLNADSSSAFCGEDKMRIMRQILFKSRHAKEIGFYQNNQQICNTSFGLLDTPVIISKPDVIAKAAHEVWINQSSDLFEKDYPVYVVKSKNYHVVLDPLDVIAQDTPEFLWQWIYKDNNQIVELFGKAKLFSTYYRAKTSVENMPVVECTADSTYCIATLDKLSRHISLTLLICLAVGVVIALIAFYWLGNIFINHYYSTELRIKRGIKNKLFFPVFQPIVDLESGEIVGCEVLARFKDEIGSLYPDEFIPIVLKTNTTISFTRGIFKAAMSSLVKQHELPVGFKVNFNIFPNDLSIENFNRLIKNKAMFSSRFQLCFEITEDEPFKNEVAQSALRKLKESGAEIAIDDFGTGYSNLTQLQSIPFDYLKVDKGFCVGLERSAFRASLIPQIVKIADSLDVPVVAEGVETKTQRRILLKEGVKLAQGFLFSKPVSALQLNTLVLAQADY